MLTWQGSRGFSVDASVRIEAEDRAGIKRLVRYCARPPFALERLHALDSTPSLASPESRLVYRFPKPDIHGRTELLLTPLELLDALAKFVPPPRVHRHRYHGVLAPNARLRPHVVAFGRPELVSDAPAAEGDVAGAAAHINNHLDRLGVYPANQIGLPQPVDAAAHQIVHQVVFGRDLVEHIADQRGFLGFAHPAEAEIGHPAVPVPSIILISHCINTNIPCGCSGP